jgi:hypothetical protein
MKLPEQLQCNLHFPDRGFRYDKVRLIGLELEAWAALEAAIKGRQSSMPLLVSLLSSSFPIVVPRPEVLRLVAESAQADISGELDGLALDAYFAIGFFLSQAQDQREAGATFEIDPGVRYEEQTVLLPDADILADLEAINRMVER